ncbi:MAG: sensor histidine kinase [Sphingobacteriales bacterium]|nr:sensor histidine kinase [Sphingobacteriales bacterium]
MKLLNRYSRVHIISAFIVMMLSSIAYYFIIQSILLRQIDKDLKVEEAEILDYIKLNNKLPLASDYKHQQIKFEASASNDITREIIDTKEISVHHGNYEPYRRLSFPVAVEGTVYKAIVYKSQVETEYLLRMIVGITGLISLVLFAVIFIINRFVLGKIWQPFFYTLSRLKNFDLHSKQSLQLPESRVEEFNDLNKSVTQMALRVTKEYESLKHFTENASHEMQTPLAIIQSKLDLLIQSANANQSEPLQSIFNATERLSKLNQTLLLLTKIGNNQYREVELIDFKELVTNKFCQFEELIKSKDLQTHLNVEDCKIFMNKDLADVLINNLLSNAIKHNVDGGVIECSLSASEMTISNSGSEVTVNKAQIFNRFYKGDNSKGSGLGLAVVKEICDAFNVHIMYSFGSMHQVTLVIPTQSPY